MSVLRQQLSARTLRPTKQTHFSGIAANILLGDDAAMTVIDMTVEPDLGAPAHISSEEDKVFIITQGRFQFLLATESVFAEAGDRILVPKGCVHSFRADGGPAKLTLVSTPARHDRFFAAIDALPEPRTPEAVAAVCAQFAQRMCGPIVGTT
jgi:mannose-6-phosphate isomerase-like protein (cupin superfamily)